MLRNRIKHRLAVAGVLPIAIAVASANVGLAAPAQPGVTVPAPSPKQPGVTTPSVPIPTPPAVDESGPLAAIPTPPDTRTRPEPSYVRPRYEPAPSRNEDPGAPESGRAVPNVPPPPIAAPDGKLRLGSYKTDIPAWMSPQTAEKANLWAAYGESRLAGLYDMAGFSPEESDRAAASTTAGAVLGGTIGAIAVGVPAASLGAMIGAIPGAVAGGAIGSVVVPGAGVGPGVGIGAGVGAVTGAALLGVSAAALGGLGGAVIGGAIGEAVGAGDHNGPAVPPELLPTPTALVSPSAPSAVAVPADVESVYTSAEQVVRSVQSNVGGVDVMRTAQQALAQLPIPPIPPGLFGPVRP